MIETNISKYEKEIEEFKAQAKVAMKKKDKRKALMFMKKKKMRETEIGKLDGMRLILEQKKVQIESQMNNKNIFEVMGEGTKAAEVLANDADINRFEELKQIHEDLEDRNNEINDFFKDYANDQYEDCEEELADLEAEIAEDEMEDIEDRPVREGKAKTKYVLIKIIYSLLKSKYLFSLSFSTFKLLQSYLIIHFQFSKFMFRISTKEKTKKEEELLADLN